jgi:aconitate hydratase 2/2-methylisocitrate dehydratase
MTCSAAPDATTRRTSAARAGDAEEQARRHRAGGRRKRGPVKFIESLKDKGHLVAYVGDVVAPVPAASPPPIRAVVHRRRTFVHPNKRFGACAWQQDRPDLLQHDGRRRRVPIELDVSQMNMAT